MSELPRVNVTRRSTFAAGHILSKPEWDEARNREVFGACSGDHGHNYELAVTVRGSVDADTGMVINLREVDRIVKDLVIRDVDHRHLNRYVLDGRVVGLSKLPRLVDAYSHRLQLQERMTREIAEAIDAVVTPRGVGVVVEGRHLCIEMRGVEKESSQTVTSCMLGVFRSDQRTRAEFLAQIQPSH